jgi:hypothetical protein
MIPPLPPPLPLLIKEKVEFYYYRQKWLERIKIMNKDYGKHVKIHDVVYLTWLTWFSDVDKTLISLLDIYYNGLDKYKMIISKFTVLSKPVNVWRPLVPRNYRYSSGLNDPSGYK